MPPVSPGHQAFQLTAIDLDGDPLTYGIDGAESFYFSVDAQTGNVTLKNSLDREVRARTGLMSLPELGFQGDEEQSRESFGGAAHGGTVDQSLAPKP